MSQSKTHEVDHNLISDRGFVQEVAKKPLAEIKLFVFTGSVCKKASVCALLREGAHTWLQLRSVRAVSKPTLS